MNDAIENHGLIASLLKEGIVKFTDSSLDEWRKNSWKTFSKEKGMILYFSNPVEQAMPQEDQEFLSKILAAIKVEFEQIAVINVDFVNLPFYEVVNKVDPKKFICLGIHPKRVQLNIDVMPYKVLHLDNRELMFGHSLKDISKDQVLKKRLWEALQQIFLK